MPLNPDLYDQLQAANRPPGNETLHRLGGSSAPDLGKLAHDAIVSNIRAGKVSEGIWQDRIKDEAMREKLQQLVVETTRLYERINITPPSLDEIAEVVNLERLTETYRWMKAAGRQPEFVLSPDIMLKNEARQLYSHLAADGGIPHNPLNEDGLSIQEDVAHGWYRFDTHPDKSIPTIDLGGAYALWTVVVIPATPGPSETEINWQGERRGRGPFKDLRHPTLSQYLTLQALRIQRGDRPIDRNAEYSWLNGVMLHAHSTDAVVGTWYAERGNKGTVVLGWTRTTSIQEDIGIRPVRG